MIEKKSKEEYFVIYENLTSVAIINVFTGTQPCSFVYILSVVAFVL